MPNGTIDPNSGDEAVLVRPFDHELWVRLRRDQLGMTIYDPLGHHIGTASARNNWIPVDGDKHVLVGELDHYYVYNGDGDEVDWNICIYPDPAFLNILSHVRAMMSPEERGELVERQHGSGFCIECEITPDEDFWLNEYFPITPLVQFPSPLVGERIAVYGPWVRDLYHGGRPEIHPCEAIWWSSETNSQGISLSRFMLVVQDDSERFGRGSDFRGPVPRPWSTFPRRANIIAALRPRIGTHMHFDLHVLHSREMAGMTDSGAVSVTQNFNGKPVITVTKRTSRPETIRMGISKVARDPDGIHLRCFLSLAISVGHDDDGREGHAFMRLDTLT